MYQVIYFLVFVLLCPTLPKDIGQTIDLLGFSMVEEKQGCNEGIDMTMQDPFALKHSLTDSFYIEPALGSLSRSEKNHNRLNLSANQKQIAIFSFLALVFIGICLTYILYRINKNSKQVSSHYITLTKGYSDIYQQYENEKIKTAADLKTKLGHRFPLIKKQIEHISSYKHSNLSDKQQADKTIALIDDARDKVNNISCRLQNQFGYIPSRR